MASSKTLSPPAPAALQPGTRRLAKVAARAADAAAAAAAAEAAEPAAAEETSAGPADAETTVTPEPRSPPSASYRRGGVTEELTEESFAVFYLAMGAEVLERAGWINENPFVAQLPPGARERFSSVRRCSFSWLTDSTSLALASRLWRDRDIDKHIQDGLASRSRGSNRLRAAILSQVAFTSPEAFADLCDASAGCDAATVDKLIVAHQMKEARRLDAQPRKSTVSHGLQTGILSRMPGQGMNDRVATFVAKVNELVPDAWARIEAGEDARQVLVDPDGLHLPNFRALCVARWLWVATAGALGESPASTSLGDGALDALRRLSGGAEEADFLRVLPKLRAAVEAADGPYGLLPTLRCAGLLPDAPQTYEHLLCEAGKVFGAGRRHQRGALRPGYSEAFAEALKLYDRLPQPADAPRPGWRVTKEHPDAAAFQDQTPEQLRRQYDAAVDRMTARFPRWAKLLAAFWASVDDVLATPPKQLRLGGLSSGPVVRFGVGFVAGVRWHQLRVLQILRFELQMWLRLAAQVLDDAGRLPQLAARDLSLNHSVWDYFLQDYLISQQRNAANRNSLAAVGLPCWEEETDVARAAPELLRAAAVAAPEEQAIGQQEHAPPRESAAPSRARARRPSAPRRSWAEAEEKSTASQPASAPPEEAAAPARAPRRKAAEEPAGEQAGARAWAVRQRRSVAGAAPSPAEQADVLEPDEGAASAREPVPAARGEAGATPAGAGMHKTVASKLRRELETGKCCKSGRELTQEQREQKRRRLETSGLCIETRRAGAAARRVAAAAQQFGLGASAAQLYRQAALLREQAEKMENAAKEKEMAAQRNGARSRPTRLRSAPWPSTAAAEAAAAELPRQE